MRGLLKAGVLLAPALAGAVAFEEDSISSAIITLHLPESASHSTTSHDLTFQFEILESNDACGYGNVTIEGQDLPEGGSGSLTMNEDIVDATWSFTCVAWNGEPQEQLLSLNIDNINGQPIEDVGFTLRFQQVAPVWISDIEGNAMMTRLHSLRQSEPNHHCNDNNDEEEIDLDAEMAELDFLRWQVAELSHEIRAKEQRLAEALGWDRHIKDCDSLKAVLVHMGLVDLVDLDLMDTAQRASTTRARSRISLNTEDTATTPKTGHNLPILLLLPMDDPISPTRLLSASVRRRLRRTVVITHLLPPAEVPIRRHPRASGPHLLIMANIRLLPHPLPPSSDAWKSTAWTPKGKPLRGGYQQLAEFEPPRDHEGRPRPQGHEDHKSFDDVMRPGTESGKQNNVEPNEAGPEPAAIDEPELRPDYEHGPPHDVPPPPPPHGRPHDGPHNGPGFDGPPPPPPPPPHPRPHGPPPHRPILIHIVSAVISLILLGVFGSVLYQRYVRKSIRTPRRHRGYSGAPWYKKMCFGPNYYEVSGDEEKEAMLRGPGEDSDDEDGDEDLVARDISQFRPAADVVSEMVAIEDARMMARSPQPSQVIPTPVAATPSLMAYHMQTYTPTNAVPMPMSGAPHMTVDHPATMAAMAAMFPDLHHDDGMAEELPAYREADRDGEADAASELASSMVSDGYRPGCSGAPYTPSESGSQGAGDILGDTKN
ncbi:hypothetical protein VMCG_02499 [Cytospora schulzeri]|uniref:Uncharacterized protein n=1 Tax=Cytospora schulzeri TaxID=448051 RepID=A0A423X1N4_9PEZI|nr:hypothetical protein VMCG_02499 [Valsa malicola]